MPLPPPLLTFRNIDPLLFLWPDKIWHRKDNTSIDDTNK